MRDSKVEQNWTLSYNFEERKKKKKTDLTLSMNNATTICDENSQALSH